MERNSEDVSRKRSTDTHRPGQSAATYGKHDATRTFAPVERLVSRRIRNLSKSARATCQAPGIPRSNANTQRKTQPQSARHTTLDAQDRYANLTEKSLDIPRISTR